METDNFNRVELEEMKRLNIRFLRVVKVLIKKGLLTKQDIDNEQVIDTDAKVD